MVKKMLLLPQFATRFSSKFPDFLPPQNRTKLLLEIFEFEMYVSKLLNFNKRVNGKPYNVEYLEND